MNMLRQSLGRIILVLLIAMPASAQSWDETTNGGGDAGTTLALAHDLSGSQYTLITGSIAATHDVDIYKITILDPSNFSATSVKTTYTGTDLQDSWLYLFDSSGNPVYSNDESPAGDPGFNSLLAKSTNAAFNPAGLGPLAAGVFYLAIATYEEKATDGSAANLFEDPRNFGPDWERMNAPNPSATGPLAGWDGGGSTAGDYEITLTGVALPVEFSSFDATTDDGTVSLRWTTLSESNNAGFDVEVAGMARDFQSIGFVQGHGTTRAQNDYTFSVQGLAYGTHSFRLRQVNYDGTSEYSPIVEIELGLQQTYLVSSAYPNPLGVDARLDIVVRDEQDVTVELFNVIGQRVASLFGGRIGENETQSISIDGSSLAGGQYLLKVQGRDFVDTQLISVLN